jgi:DNA processing protein
VIDRDELAAWLRLLETPHVGRDSARRLLAAFGSPQAIFQAPSTAWREVVGAQASAALTKLPENLTAQFEATLAWLDGATAEQPRDVLTLGDPTYPDALLQTADPPLLLYLQGQTKFLNASAMAVVGSRNPTPQGLENARAFASHLSQVGLTVVSGLAMGVDGAAHEGALTGPGSTVAVVGTGLDRVYPSKHRDLAHRIAQQGLMVSEYSIGTPPLPAHFPQRNRIIAGLARGTLVTEAALQSGSLITARLAVEAGREVFAIPGSIHSPQARGCHALIKQGAKLVETAQDILEELCWGQRTISTESSTAEASPETPEDALLTALGHDPVSLDALVARTGYPAAELSTRLLEFELDGQVARLPGQLFQRISTG